MKPSFENIFVTQNQIFESRILWYFNNKVDVPIPIRQFPNSNYFLLLDGHNQLAKNFLSKEMPNYKIVNTQNDIINSNEFSDDFQKYVSERNHLIQRNYESILNNKFGLEKRTIVDLLNKRPFEGHPSIIEELYMVQNDFQEAEEDFFKKIGIRTDLDKYKINSNL